MTADPHDEGDPDADHDCGCSHAVAQETHELVAAIGAARGIDLCDPAAEHTTDEDHDLQVIHDHAISQGAECQDIEPDDDDPSGEFPAIDPPASSFRPRSSRD